VTGASSLIPAWIDGHLVPFDKIAAHREGHRHKAVSVFVLDGDRILIQRRAMSKYHTPGLWANTCCTHPHWGEPGMDCAVRRLREELGINGIAPALAGQIEYRADVGAGMTEHEVVEVFVADAPPDLRITPNPSEVMDLRWITLTDLVTEVADAPARFTPWLRIYLADHRSLIFRAA